MKRYPRTIDDSVRRTDDRRKVKRADKKQRQALERRQKLEEIKRLKNLKKKEIFDKMKRLKAVAGDEQLALNMDDLDGDFDPKEYDRRMQVGIDTSRINNANKRCVFFRKCSMMITIRKEVSKKRHRKCPMRNSKVNRLLQCLFTHVCWLCSGRLGSCQ